MSKEQIRLILAILSSLASTHLLPASTLDNEAHVQCIFCGSTVFYAVPLDSVPHTPTCPVTLVRQLRATMEQEER